MTMIRWSRKSLLDRRVRVVSSHRFFVAVAAFHKGSIGGLPKQNITPTTDEIGHGPVKPNFSDDLIPRRTFWTPTLPRFHKVNDPYYNLSGLGDPPKE